MRETHVDFNVAWARLINCVYEWHPGDLAQLTEDLLNGTYNGKMHSEYEVALLKLTPGFGRRFGSVLRKVFWPLNTMRVELTNWGIHYKCSNSEGEPIGLGRKNPRNGFVCL